VSLQLAVRFIHLLAVVTWVGGMLFIALVLVPITRRLEDAALRTRLVQDSGRRFRTVGWIALGLIVATGLGSLALRPELLWAPRFHAKAGLVVLALRG
jgi:uncharacterized membrane protein